MKKGIYATILQGT